MSWDLSKGWKLPIVIVAKASKPRSGFDAWPALALGIDRARKSTGPEPAPKPEEKPRKDGPKDDKEPKDGKTARAPDARPCAAPPPPEHLKNSM